MADITTVDTSDIVEHLFNEGVTDGLPVAPPTPEKVEALLAETASPRDEILGGVPERHAEVSVLEAAVNAAMAGCRPEYFPFVVAAARSMLAPKWGGHAMFASTSGGAICVVASGPKADEVGLHARNGALGSGFRANATIGRALRLIAVNSLGNQPSGGMDGSCQGNPGKFSLCFAEDPPPEPWQALRLDYGYRSDETTVTVMVAEAPRQVANHLTLDPERILNTFAATMRCEGIFGVGKKMQGIVVMGPEHAGAMISNGWTQTAVREYLVEHTRLTHAQLEAAGIVIERGTTHTMEPGSDGKVPTFESPDDIVLVTAGGHGLGWSSYIPAAAPKVHTEFVVSPVK